MKTKLLIISIASPLFLFGCSSKPDCASSDTKKLVGDIARENGLMSQVVQTTSKNFLEFKKNIDQIESDPEYVAALKKELELSAQIKDSIMKCTNTPPLDVGEQPATSNFPSRGPNRSVSGPSKRASISKSVIQWICGGGVGGWVPVSVGGDVTKTTNWARLVSTPELAPHLAIIKDGILPMVEERAKVKPSKVR
ncbi:hypothetical protein, partial [Flavobacterium sp.]|uniref:hypothetical protein n=1 Tax=Flavobacterium sp. TaxID=239 RepID=UPI0037BF032A